MFLTFPFSHSYTIRCELQRKACAFAPDAVNYDCESNRMPSRPVWHPSCSGIEVRRMRVSLLPPMRILGTNRYMRRRRDLVMKHLQKILASALIFSALAVSSLAVEPQRDRRDSPPKDPKVFDKKDKEPKREEPRREQRDKPKDNKRDKP